MFGLGANASDGRLSTRIRQINLVVSVGLIALLITIFALDERATTFRVDARTGTAEIVAANEHPKWPRDLIIEGLPDACVFDGFAPANGATIQLDKRVNQPLQMTITGPGDIPESAGIIHCAGDRRIAADAYVTSVVDTFLEDQNADVDHERGLSSNFDHPPTIRFVGKLNVGIAIDSEDLTPSVLERGELVMETRSILPGFGRVETRYPLDKGDRLTFKNGGSPDKSMVPVSAGLVSLDRLDDDPYGFRLIARTEAQSAEILPFGLRESESIAVAPNFLERSQAGAQGIFIGLFGALLLHILSVLTMLVERYEKGASELKAGCSDDQE